MEVEVEPMTTEEALREVLKRSMMYDGLARGLKECVKALDRREAHLCVLAQSCDEPAYVKLIKALCKEHNIPIMEVMDGKMLGEFAGLCKIDEEGIAVRVVGCSCAVVKSWGEESNARAQILETIANM